MWDSCGYEVDKNERNFTMLCPLSLIKKSVDYDVNDDGDEEDDSENVDHDDNHDNVD